MFANPRNAAAGSSASSILDHGPTAVALFRLQLGRDKRTPQIINGIFCRGKMGLSYQPETRRCDTPEDIMALHAGIGAKRALLGYDIDGVVYKVVDRLDWQNRLGFVSARRVGRSLTNSLRRKPNDPEGN